MFRHAAAGGGATCPEVRDRDTQDMVDFSQCYHHAMTAYRLHWSGFARLHKHPVEFTGQVGESYHEVAISLARLALDATCNAVAPDFSGGGWEFNWAQFGDSSPLAQLDARKAIALVSRHIQSVGVKAPAANDYVKLLAALRQERARHRPVPDPRGASPPGLRGEMLNLLRNGQAWGMPKDDLGLALWGPKWNDSKLTTTINRLNQDIHKDRSRVYIDHGFVRLDPLP